MPILIVSETTARSAQLFDKFLRRFEDEVLPATVHKDRREIVFGDARLRFISKDKFDICTKGLRGVQIVDGSGLEDRLDKELKNDGC